MDQEPRTRNQGPTGLPDKLQLRIVSADRSLVHEEVDEVEIPGADGYFGVLPGHTELVAMLGAGELWYRIGPSAAEDQKHYLALAFGFAEVQPGRVTILADVAEKSHEIDVPRAEAAKKRAEERIAQETNPGGLVQASGASEGAHPRAIDDMDLERARIALMKSLIRLQVASRAKIRS